jgi:imidazolonepropionase-like amidohydrolase
MRLSLTLSALLAGASMAHAAPAALADLAKPPVDAQAFTIMSTAGVHGHSFAWKAADGALMGRESLNLRGQVFEIDSASRLGPDGMIQHMVVRGYTPQGDAAETFDIADGKASWTSPVDAGSSAYASPAMYSAFGGPMELNEIFIDALMAAPNRTLNMLPGGQVHAEPLTTLQVGAGPTRRTITAYAVTGLANTPLPLWVDDKGKFFGLASAIGWVPAGYENDFKAMITAQDEAMAGRSPNIAHSLFKKLDAPVAFTHVRAFVDGARFVADETVVIDHGVITKVGPAAKVAVPAGTQVIDGAGKTLVPGLWDSHQHVGDDFTGPTLLSLGVTSVRDPGNFIDLTLARAARRAKGDLLMPHVYPSVLIDGKGPLTAQVASVATSQDEALAIVRKAKADGFVAIKFYGTYNPAWVAPAAAEAHRLGLHVHGHLPAGMRTMDAINDGYDEITHIYFVAMQAMPQPVVDKSNTILRMEGPAKYFKDVDLTADPMKSLIATMAARHIAADPTLVVVESLMVPDNGDLSPAYAPFVGTLPPAVERSFRQGGLALASGYTRADYRASFKKLEALVEAMHKAGVRIVAGTDGSGLELVRELELYVDAGFTPEEALESATIEAARLQHVEGRTGSIAVGKAADLALVEGDPSRNIGDLRHTRLVFMDGGMMNCDDLRKVAGISARPKFWD